MRVVNKEEAEEAPARQRREGRARSRERREHSGCSLNAVRLGQRKCDGADS
jgi:hypothetical protein